MITIVHDVEGKCSKELFQYIAWAWCEIPLMSSFAKPFYTFYQKHSKHIYGASIE